TIVATLVYLAMYALLRGGRARFIALEVLGAFAALEIHHVIETIAGFAYTPGLVTSVPYVAFGLLLMHAAAQEYHAESSPRPDTAPAPTLALQAAARTAHARP